MVVSLISNGQFLVLEMVIWRFIFMPQKFVEIMLWDGLPEQFFAVQQVGDLLSRLASYVCRKSRCRSYLLAESMLNDEHNGYHKENWLAVAGNLSYKATVRGSKCARLCMGVRCYDWRQARSQLRAKKAWKLSCKHKANALLRVEGMDVKLSKLH